MIVVTVKSWGWENLAVSRALPNRSTKRAVTTAAWEALAEHRDLVDLIKAEERLTCEIDEEQAAAAAAKRSRFKLVRGDAA
jgi:hypothetical protein